MAIVSRYFDSVTLLNIMINGILLSFLTSIYK
jgi:hypothetical protein